MPFTCPEPQCAGREFPTERSLEAHRRRVHVDIAKRKARQTKADGRVACPLCPKDYASRKYLARHIHDDHGRSITDFADLGQISQPASLPQGFAEDRVTETATETAKRIKCPKCQRDFKARAVMAVHARREHGLKFLHGGGVVEPNPVAVSAAAASVSGEDVLQVLRIQRDAYNDVIKTIEGVVYAK